MSRNLYRGSAFWLGAVICIASETLMAETNQTDAVRWLEKSELAPRFAVPDKKGAWERQRRRVRTQLWELLGKLPPRPKVPKVETLSTKDEGDYVVEKFQ